MAEHGDDPADSYRGGESFNDVIARVAPSSARSRPGATSILAVGHGIFLRFFLMHCALDDAFRPSHAAAPVAARLDQLRPHHRSSTERRRSASGYAVAPWRCVTWTARPRDPA